METTKQAGTTPAILGPYLPYEVEVQYVKDLGPLRFPTVVCLDAEASRLKRGHHLVWEPIAEFLPVLRDFSDLTSPLSDGKIPSVEVARLLYDNMIGEGGKVSTYFDRSGNVVVIESHVAVLTIYPSWLMKVGDGLFAGPSEYDYLRSLHFAVGLQPHQYIHKTN